MIAASGVQSVKTNAFQSPLNAFPGLPRKLMLLTYEPNIDSTTAHPGSERPPAMNSLVPRLRTANQQPSPTVSPRYAINTARSIICAPTLCCDIARFEDDVAA